MKKYSLTPEHEAQLKPWADKWTANAMSTKSMDEEERNICRKAVKELYLAANLTPPLDKHIVFVPSPFVLRFAGGFAAAIWHIRKNNIPDATYDAIDAATAAATRAATDAATHDATIAATIAATYDATHAATYDATHDATYAATDAATRAATRAATYDATRAASSAAIIAATRAASSAATHDATHTATRGAIDDAIYAATYAATDAAIFAAIDDATYAATRVTRDATHDATHAATYAATAAATIAATSGKIDKGNNWFKFPIEQMKDLSFKLGLDNWGLKCAEYSYSMWQGGNQWSSWISFLTFFRYIVKLDLDYSKFEHYEQLTIHSGPRIMHEKFCMISDRPRVLKVDNKNRPHCETGPFCEWSDGSALYALNGVRVPQYIVETPGTWLNTLKVLGETNIDVRREGLRKIPLDKLIRDTNAKELDTWIDDRPWCDYVLYDMDFKDGKTRRVLRMKNPSVPGVLHFERVEDNITTVKQALAWRNGQEDYLNPQPFYYERKQLT